jgi:hypothetical protein
MHIFKNRRVFLTLAIHCFSFSAMAQVAGPRLPRAIPFTYHWQGQTHSTAKAVFVDFRESTSVIRIDLNSKKVTQETRILLLQPKAGNIAFDLVEPEVEAWVDGTPSGVLEFETPGLETKLRAIETPTEPGEHVLVIRSAVGKGVAFDPAGFALRFGMNDSEDRSFLEKYLPTNLEYDTYAMRFDFELVGGTLDDFDWYANGEWARKSNRRISLRFSTPFNCSSPFIRVFPRDVTESLRGEYTTGDGRVVPIQIFKLKTETSTDLARFLGKARQILTDLETRYGAWAHPALLIQAYGQMTATGGMEYAGATQSAFLGLDHEIFHSYFGRGAMPENGNAGWIDEALATWRDHGYPLGNPPELEVGDLGANGLYTRTTNGDAYDLGGAFIAHLANLFGQKGLRLDATLARFYAQYRNQTYSTDDFQRQLETDYGESLEPLFQKYIYGRRR